MRKEALIVCIIVLGLVFAQVAIGQEEVKVPFSAIKPSCYGEIDMTKAEFPLSEVGEKCVTEEWLKEHKSEQESESKKAEDSKITKPKRAEIPEANIEIDNPSKVLTVLKSAVMEERKAEFLKEQQDKEEVEVSVSWIKDSWLADNRPELAKSAVLKLLENQPTIEEVVQTINTPRQLRKFMDGYFRVDTLEGRDGVTAFSPSKMLETKLGVCRDWATFSAYILKWNGYQAQIFNRPIHPMDGGHSIAIWQGHRGQYHLLNYTNFYWNAGETPEEVATFLEKNNDEIDSIFYYALYDPLILNVRKGHRSAFVKACLEKIPHIKELNENQLKLGEEEHGRDNFAGKIVKIEKLADKKYSITFVVWLDKRFKNAFPKFVLVDVIANPDTSYTDYNWSKGEMENKDFEEVVWVGEKGGFHAKEDTTKIGEITQFTAIRIWST